MAIVVYVAVIFAVLLMLRLLDHNDDWNVQQNTSYLYLDLYRALYKDTIQNNSTIKVYNGQLQWYNDKYKKKYGLDYQLRSIKLCYHEIMYKTKSTSYL